MRASPPERGHALLTERGHALLTPPERGFALLIPRERGFALLIVLWSVVLLALLATGITAAGRTDVRLVANLRAAAQAEAAADGAVPLAAFHLLDPAATWAADGQERGVDVPGARVVLRIEDQAGKINPNTASLELLTALFRACGAAAEPAATLAAAVVEWRFPRAAPVGFGGLTLGGPVLPAAPSRAYQGLDYGPPGAPFESLDELRLVAGMTPAVLAAALPNLSLEPDADPDPRLASPVVLQALAAAFGPVRVPPGPPPPPRAVAIAATAQTPEGSRFTRLATLRLGRTEKEPPVTVRQWAQRSELP